MPNRLADATSPYLLQHAHNPVAWQEWGTEALEEAERRDVPILLSIGYAACHWCHVMERESFEDEKTAAAMNEWFVPVKVDREERPDLDAVYMDAVQAMTGQGGWPMTVFLSPDGRPFYGGTYFPPEDRHGMPAFGRVMAAVHDAWTNRRQELLEQGSALLQYIERASQLPRSEDALSEDTLRRAVEVLSRSFDSEWGGFGAAPKFPQPMTLDFLLRMHVRGIPAALDMAKRTLTKMARGGIFDQVGGGFHRYSVDRVWLVPHFEKMLYDNAQLLRLYTRGWQATADDLFRETALATAGYLLREMRHPSGGFFSSQDADSESVEGKFNAWPFDELMEAATPRGGLAAAFYAATPEGNWEGANVLWRPRDDDVVAVEQGMTVPLLLDAMEGVRSRLFEARSKRVPPGTDDKVLASWNGLAISGLAEAGRVFERPDLIDAAAGAARFVLAELRDGSGRLMRSWRDGRTSGAAFLDDHAAMAGACLDLYETTFDERWFTEAVALAGDAIRLFADEENGGFFDTGSDAQPLVVRPKDLFDNAVPSGNSLMLEVLLRIGAFTGEPSYEERAERSLRALQAALANAPAGFGHALGALDLALARAKEVAISGDPASEAARRLAEVVWRRFLPNRVLAVGRSDGSAVPLLKDRAQTDGRATAYVCERFVCKQPVTEPQDLEQVLKT
ncbi:MAG: thioredoxin domain-containing protein [Actinomycetota bacterium]